MTASASSVFCKKGCYRLRRLLYEFVLTVPREKQSFEETGKFCWFSGALFKNQTYNLMISSEHFDKKAFLDPGRSSSNKSMKHITKFSSQNLHFMFVRSPAQDLILSTLFSEFLFFGKIFCLHEFGLNHPCFFLCNIKATSTILQVFQKKPKLQKNWLHTW